MTKRSEELDQAGLIALRTELARISIKAFERRLVFGTGGNISVRIPDTNLAYITPTGVSLGDTTIDNISIIDIETGEPTPDSPTKPSKERYFHAAIYRIRQDINSLCHVHPPYANGLVDPRQGPADDDDHGARKPGQGACALRGIWLLRPARLRCRGRDQ